MTKIYIDYNGRTACADHGGMYLKYALQAKPNARSITTPLGNWMRLTQKEMTRPGMECETCYMNQNGRQIWEDADIDTPHEDMAFPMPSGF